MLLEWYSQERARTLPPTPSSCPQPGPAGAGVGAVEGKMSWEAAGLLEMRRQAALGTEAWRAGASGWASAWRYRSQGTAKVWQSRLTSWHTKGVGLLRREEVFCHLGCLVFSGHSEDKRRLAFVSFMIAFKFCMDSAPNTHIPQYATWQWCWHWGSCSWALSRCLLWPEPNQRSVRE